MTDPDSLSLCPNVRAELIPRTRSVGLEVAGSKQLSWRRSWPSKCSRNQGVTSAMKKAKMKAKKSNSKRDMTDPTNPTLEISEHRLEASAVWGGHLELMPAEQAADEPTPLLTSTIWGVLPSGTRLHK